MFEKTYITPIKGEAMRPFFRTPFGFVDNMLSEVENLWQRPLFRMNRRFEKDLSWVPTFDVYEHDGEMVVKAVEAIAVVSRQNLVAVEQMNGAAKSLAGESDALRQRVALFQV